MRKLIKIKYALLLVGAAALFASCDGNDKKDDTNGGAATLKALTNLSNEKKSTEIKT